MVARASTIENWIERGIEKGATHLVTFCDVCDWEDYPVYCSSVEEARRLYGASGQDDQKVEGVYNLNGDIKKQLAMRDCFEF